MSNIDNTYTFPVQDRYDAREVVEPDFDILGREEELYVDLSLVRNMDYLEEIKAQLNLNDENILVKPARVYPKIMFSGHKGSGKTSEVRNMQRAFNHKKGYLSILVETEAEIEISKFKPEDFYVLLITHLVKRLIKDKIPFNSIALKHLEKDWLSEKDVINEINEISKDETEIVGGIGVDFLKFFKLGVGFKGLFANESKTSQVIRQKIIANTPSLIDNFNLVLKEIRASLRTNPQLPQDILFIFDGSEKIRFDTYENLFINNATLISKIDLSIIAAVPILTFYKITHRLSLQFYDTQILPMLKPNPTTAEKLKEILERRLVLTNFIEDDALDLVIRKSGGSIRQLLKIMNKALIVSKNKINTQVLEEKVLKRMQNEMYESLTSEHKDILRNKKYIDPKTQKSNIADAGVWELVDAMILLKYNGTISINPLIEDDFNE